MKFLIDGNLPQLLADRIRAAGIPASHVAEHALDRAVDPVVWRFACGDAWIMVTKDSDFVRLQQLSRLRGQVLWIRCGNCRTAPLLDLVLPRLTEIVRDFRDGARLIEIR